MSKGLISFPKDDKPPIRYLDERSLIERQLQEPVAGFVVKAIERQVEMEDLQKWGLAPVGELKRITVPETSEGLGEAIWGLISAITP